MVFDFSLLKTTYFCHRFDTKVMIALGRKSEEICFNPIF